MTTGTLWLDVRSAADRIGGHVRRTPMLSVPELPGLLLKAEHLQRAGSFKARGAANALLGLGATRLVTGSSGNHGIAVATLARAAGAGVTVVMADGSSAAKAGTIRGLGARVRAVAGGVADRDRLARNLAEDTGATLVPSSDHELVVAGQGTVVLEVLDDAPDTEVIFVPTGGGGLLAGACLAAERLTSRVRIVGVEPVDARRYARSLAAGRPVRLPRPATIADGLRGQSPGEVPLPIIQRRVDDLVAVTDDQIVAAMRVLHRAGIDAEPSGAVALAGALASGMDGRTVAVVSGGNHGNIGNTLGRKGKP